MQDEIAPHTDPISLAKLSGAVSALQSDSPDRLEVLAEVTSAIDAGAYQVDALGLSESLISESLR